MGGFCGDGEDARVSVTEFEPRIRVERQHIVFGDAVQQSVDVDGLDRGVTDGGGFAFAGLGEDCGQSLAQGLEFELVEQAGQLSRVSFAPCEVVEAQSQVDVVEEAIETEVPFHFRDVVAQLLTDLAADRLGVVQHSRQIAVSGEPFRGSLVADSGHAGQIVGLLTDERGQSAVVDGGDAVLVLDGLGRHPVEVADPAFGVEDRHRLRSQLEGVLVPGHHLDRCPCLGADPGHRGQCVIGFEALFGHDRDAHRGDDVLDEVDLGVEFRWGLRASGLVFGVFLEPEGLPAEVEGHGHMARCFVAEDVDEHRDEAVDGVRRLAGAGGEVLHGQGVERPIGQGVSVDEQEGFV